MNHPFMNTLAQALCSHGLLVVRFNFDYMQQIAETGKRRPPNRMPQLMACFQDRLQQARSLWPAQQWFVAGKSMGGRVASMVLNDSDARGAACIGYPFHPPKKPDNTRLEPLQITGGKPVLVTQGTRDALGSREDVAGYQLAKNVDIVWLEDGDHDLKPRKKSGYSQQEHIECAAAAIAQFCLS